MSDCLQALDEAISSVARLRQTLSKRSSTQVRSQDERALVKATALAWIKKQRFALGGGCSAPSLTVVDQGFGTLLEFSDRDITRERYKNHLKLLRQNIVALRREVIADPMSLGSTDPSEPPPDWSELVPDPEMRAILSRRWQETEGCLSVGAHLAATVMMGAMLEALLLSRVNHVTDKSILFKTKAAPIHKKTGKHLPLQHWTLQHYIDVAHEMKWIRQSARDVSILLRDYRNYIHPAKELSHGMRIEKDDSSMFWVVFRSLAEQIARSVS